MFTTKNVGKLRKDVEKNVGNTSEKCWQTYEKCLREKILASLPKNINEKLLADFRKMLTSSKNVDKNVGNTPKNVDEKMSTTLSENVE
jgi:hypothetical protein